MKNKSLVEKIVIIIIALGLVFLCILFGRKLINKINKNRYNKIVDNILLNAKEWIKDEKFIKIDGKSYYIDLSDLSKKYMDDKEILNPIDKTKMNGCIKATYQKVYKNYNYSYSNDTCDNIMTLGDKVTDYNNIVTDNSGLYYLDSIYRFKGDKVSNYVKIDDTLFRIISIDNKKIKLITDSIINELAFDSTREKDNNSYCTSNDGCNAYAANTTTVTQDSEINVYLNNAYLKSLKINKSYLSLNNQWNVGKIDKDFDKLTLDLLESADTTSYTIGLLSLGDYYDSVIDHKTYLDIDDDFYLLIAVNDTVDEVFIVTENNTYGVVKANTVHGVRPVIYLNYNVMAKGEGTKKSPYIIK